MRIIHTADWHIGQQLHGFSRCREHESFLVWLHEQCMEHRPDGLVIAGDVFHHTNPTNDAIEIFARFTERLLTALPSVKVIAVAGNHDSAGRFDALRPLMRDGVHLTGSLGRVGDAYEVASMLINVGDGAVLAMPYLRLCDLPPGDGDTTPADRVRACYARCWKEAEQLLNGASCVLTGHLHVAGGIESESERPILIGGEHAVPLDIFPAGPAYVALGHLHCAQQFADGRVRYSGSPIPLSATERSYNHRVILLDVAYDGLVTSHDIFVPRSVAHLRVPAHGAVAPTAALALIAELTEGIDTPDDGGEGPFLEVHLQLSAPQPMAASKLSQEIAAAKLPVRIVKVVLHHDAVTRPHEALERTSPITGNSPQTLFIESFEVAHHGQLPNEAHRAAFLEAWQGDGA
jgi:DNA repair protein SbcD/Mre11